MDLDKLEWSCHFCGDVRPDREIGVVSKERTLGGGVTMQENRRYCLDREKCQEAAKEWQESGTSDR